MLPAKTPFRSNLWKKTMVALTGLVLFGFLVLHVAGNLKAFQGSEHLNEYAHFLRVAGVPMIPAGGALWATRLILLAAAFVHVRYALQLANASTAARGMPYQHELAMRAGKTSRVMKVTGLVLLGFIVFHILHFTTGTLHPRFVEGDVFANLTYAFKGWWGLLFVPMYVGAMGVLGYHLTHGLWSFFQTLGWNHPRYNALREKAAVGVAIALAAAFALVPLATFIGVIG